MSAMNMATVLERLQAIQSKPSTQAPVTDHGRTFRRCSSCGRQGWHPQASAEVCCGQRVTLIEQPAMSVDDFVRFIHCPTPYASGAISKADVLDMMNKDGIKTLPDEIMKD